jgi:glycosyltransferase involved in cell wall biosynthesis
MDKLRILMLCDSTHPNAINWIESFKKYADCEVQTWTLPKFQPNFVGKIKRNLHWFKFPFLVKSIIKDFQPHVVIGYRVTSYGFLTTFIKNIPTVTAMQGVNDVWPPNHWSNHITGYLATKAYRHSALVHCWGRSQAYNAIQLGAAPNKIVIMPRGIDADFFSLSNNNSLLNADKIHLTVSRALASDYRQDIIIKAVHALINKGFNLHLNIAGDGPLKESYMDLVASLKMNAFVSFLGRINNTELKALLHQTHLYISMPITDGVSASLLEGMACGCIPVVSDVGPNREWIINNKNGKLVTVDDIEGLSAAIENVLGNRDYWNSIRTANRQMVEAKASTQNNIKYFVERYKNLKSECVE